ncbi:MAG: phosphoribosylformylglycinamidine cyclo-ligase [Candidatus Omnitrophica bacterium]|nr:phosphoribosylformylglycinamidine cyclo-ligase [Candidatus Omnitrophota bacterium]
MNSMTYKKSGVDIKSASVFKNKIRTLVRGSFRPEVLKDIGGFGSFFSMPSGYKEPVLVASTDGVGTKLKIASLVGKHDTVGIDLVAMNVNDILCAGAQPLFFLDYIACGKLNPDVLCDVVKGINAGCVQSGCSLVGGETAEMPGMYANDEYDLAGFCTGVVEKKKIVDGSRIRAGDVVIGLESSGIHSNGYSLVRKVLSAKQLLSMSKELLIPTRIYVKQVLNLLRHHAVNGISHITGGAFYDKIARILPSDISVRINKHSWKAPELFRFIQNKGGIDDKEMYHTLNMGIGMVLIVAPDAVDKVQKFMTTEGVKNFVIGEAVRGNKTVEVI